MGAEQIRDILHHRIEQADEHFLQAMLIMVEAYAAQNDLEDAFDTAGYQAGQPITIDQLKAKVSRAEAQIDQGDFLTTDELRQEAAGWLSESTK